jgi:predicted permease
MVARLRGFIRRNKLDSDFDQELEMHLAMAAEEKIRRGMTPEEARRAARVELGGLTQLQEAGRAARGLPLLDSFGLDVRLGLRMMRKSWGLTLLGGLAMTVTIAICATTFVVLGTLAGSTIPLDEGDRIVRLMTRSRDQSRVTSVQDFEWWRKEMRSVEDIAAFRTVERDLVTKDGLAGRVSVAQMTSVGFRVARVQPLLGRPLLEEDERDVAAPVVVIGYGVWQARFSGDAAALGQTVRLGGVDHVVIGIMPEDFAFPVNHQAWTAFRANRLSDARASADVVVFARLASGVTLERAQAEIVAIGPAPDAETNEDMLIRVVPYADSFAFIPSWLYLVPLLIALLLVPPCANIAILVYARNVSRQEEFAARYVLGASRSRIVGQLFIEAFVLAAVAGGVGLALVYQLLEWVQRYVVEDQELRLAVPFWMKANVSFETVLYVACLVAFAAMVAGGLPALRATGRMRQSGFQGLGSRTSPRLSKTWTALVVAQVAASMAVLPAVGELSWTLLRLKVQGLGFAAEEYLTAQIVMKDGEDGQDGAPSPVHFRNLQAELVRQVEAGTGVSRATLSARIHAVEPNVMVETDGAGQEPFAARSNQVDSAFFDVFGTRLLTGRVFETADFETGSPVVIVNRTFAEGRFGTDWLGRVPPAALRAPRDPLGMRLRYLGGGKPDSTPGPWYEIIGVVDEISQRAPRPRIYHPMLPGQIHPVNLTMRVGPAIPSGLAGRLVEITRRLDPNLRLEQFSALDDVYRGVDRPEAIFALGLGTGMLVVVLFSAAGIHTLVVFAVAQRRHEIGIRSALGAPPRRLVADAFRRDLSPVVGGAVVGALLALAIDRFLLNGGISVTALSASAAFMILIGCISVAGPARRVLQVDSTEALRES